MKKSILLFLAAVMLTSFSINAKGFVIAYVIDSKGPVTNIRTAPSANAKVAMTLPTDKGSYVLTLDKVKNGWWRIADVIEEYEENIEIPLTGSKTGYWIHGSLLYFSPVGDPTGCLRSGPSAKSKAIRMSDSTELKFQPIGFKGQWIKVKTANGRYTGWMHRDRVCYNPLTTCP